MRGSWNLREWEYTYFTYIMRTKLEEALRNKDEAISLTQYDINPANMCDILKHMGWNEEDFETNGWEQDCWQYFSHENYPGKLCVYSCGMTFDLTLTYTEEE